MEIKVDSYNLIIDSKHNSKMTLLDLWKKIDVIEKPPYYSNILTIEDI